jgi:hypothetical protein
MAGRARYWQGVVAERAGSGQTQVAFCRQRRIEPGPFAWWKRQLRQEGLATDGSVFSDRPDAAAQASNGFVAALRSTASSAGFEVLLRSGRTIRVPAGFQEQELLRLLSVLERPC